MATIPNAPVTGTFVSTDSKPEYNYATFGGATGRYVIKQPDTNNIVPILAVAQCLKNSVTVEYNEETSEITNINIVYKQG